MVNWANYIMLFRLFSHKILKTMRDGLCFTFEGLSLLLQVKSEKLCHRVVHRNVLLSLCDV